METESNKNEDIKIENELAVTIPNRKQIISNKTMMLDIPEVPVQGNKVQLFPGLTSGNLLSIWQYFKSNCSAHF